MIVEHSILHLSLIKDIGPATVQHLVALCGSLEELKTLYTQSPEELRLRFHLTQKRAQAIVTGLADLSLLEKELALIEKHNVSWTTLYNDDYPVDLKAIHVPPVILYWQGAHPSSFTKTVALVGSRNANAYGKSIIDLFVPELVNAGCTIVSGGAFGIDTMAHQATLSAGGQTCVILGSGLLHPYPSQNTALFASIGKAGGTLLSIFPLDTRPTAFNFPARNRVIAGLSKGCVVIQAAQKSGARITAEFALEQGKSVCAVPGSIQDPLSVGCHELIQNGALLVTDATSILQELNYAQPTTKLPVTEKNRTVSPEQIQVAKPLTPSDTIIHLCARPTSVNDLMAATKLDFSELNELLFDLQISGKITQTFSGLWSRK